MSRDSGAKGLALLVGAAIVSMAVGKAGAQQESLIQRPGPPALEDFETDSDRDGVPDVLLAKGYSYDYPCDEVFLYRGLGGGEFSEPTVVLSGNGTTDIHVGPVDPGGESVAVLSGSLYEHATNFLVAIPSSVFEASAEFIRADANGDGNVDVSDAVSTLMYLFMGGVARCRDAGDANDDGILNITDPVFTLLYLFLGGSAPREPFPDRGWDPTSDALGCARYP